MKERISYFLLLLSFLFFGIFVYRGNQIDAYLLEFPEDQELLENDGLGELGKFEEKDPSLPYSRGEPLDGELFNREYAEFRWPPSMVILLSGWASPFKDDDMWTVTLSEPLYYYASPQDAKPALVLEAGKEYLIYSRYLESADISSVLLNYCGGLQFGIGSWPSYEEGWRYGIPFIPMEDFEKIKDGSYEPPGFYYVGLGDLKRVIFSDRIERKTAEGLAEEISEDDRRNLDLEVYGTDWVLYGDGFYRSPDLVERTPLNISHRRHTLDMWDGLCLALGTGFLGAAVGFFLKLRRVSRPGRPETDGEGARA